MSEERTKQRRTLRDQQREDTRRRVMDAALMIFRRDGVGPSRIEDIVAAAGVSRGTFYFHFPTKEDVLLEVLMQSQVQICAVVEARGEDASVVDVLHTVARAMSDFWSADPKLLPDVGMVAMRQIARQFSEIEHTFPIYRMLVARFRVAQGRSEINSPMPPELLTALFLTNVFAAALAWCEQPQIPMDMALNFAVDFFLRGVGIG